MVTAELLLQRFWDLAWSGICDTEMEMRLQAWFKFLGYILGRETKGRSF